MSSYRTGFTLAEVLIVVVIIGVIATAFLGSTFGPARQRGRDLQRKTDLASVGKTLELYMNDYNQYPLSSGDGRIVACNNSAAPSACNWGSIWNDEKVQYMGKLPTDPQPGSSNIYRYISDGRSWQLFARLERSDDRDVSATEFAYSCGNSNCNFGISSSNTNVDAELLSEEED